jgi:two-component system, chemotaxis family, chemotaxis protein CheY
MRFLIVDDAEAPLKVLQRLLEALGHEVVGSARNGVEAVELYERLHPDVAIIDVIMPRMNGLDALRTIRAAHPDACIVMASSLRSCQTALEAERRGALYCLAKPYDACRLQKVIEEIARSCGKALPGRTRAATAAQRVRPVA